MNKRPSMKRFRALIACLFLTSLAVPSLSSAQSRPQTREGPFIGLGFGYGSLCSTCDGERKAGGIVYLKAGQAVHEAGGIVYLKAGQGLFLKGGAGRVLLGEWRSSGS